MNMEQPQLPNSIKKIGTENFNEIKDSIINNINNEIAPLKSKLIETAFQQEPADTDDNFGTFETRKVQKEISQKEMHRDNLENPDYFTLN